MITFQKWLGTKSDNKTPDRNLVNQQVKYNFLLFSELHLLSNS